MADTRERSGVVARRLLGVFAALLLLTLLVAPAAAGPKEELEQARAELKAVREQIGAKRAVLQNSLARAGQVWERVQAAQARFEAIVATLHDTKDALAAARDDYTALESRVAERARETFMAGPASNLEFVLGAVSFSDLSARMEYVDALTRSDADLANEYQNLKNELSARARDQERLASNRAELLMELKRDQAELDAQLAEQQALLDELDAKERRAVELAKDAKKDWREFQRQLSSVVVRGSGVFRVCPVGIPRAVYDGFGAPRYSGGYHPHAGNDIIAPMEAPIYAPFDGYARASYNALGGNAVYVYGEDGYVYNAHLVRTGYTGPVQAGDVIGNVGETGDTSTPHDHFEWHPNNTPAQDQWPRSPYGYSVIYTGSKPAVNPWPLLQEVC
jgi:murein DD-endopeptidase MepM/ murein hydrolase activator NlpD